MKKILIYLPFLALATACITAPNEELESKNYITFSGVITNPKGDEFTILDPSETFVKTIKINEDGSFSDTLKVIDSIYSYYFNHGGEYSKMYLKNGYDLSFKINTEEFDETVEYSGNGAKENNYLAANSLFKEQEVNFSELADIENTNYKTQLAEIEEKLKARLAAVSDLDSKFIEIEKDEISSFFQDIEEYRSSAIKKAETLAKLIGNPSPNFKFKTPDGEEKTLADFSGKYLYVDVWATWCGPCKAEIPALQELVDLYEGKNINFLSISTDKSEKEEEWKNMIIDKQMTWTQVISDKDWSSDFVQDYSINSIPRFILIDPKGNVVDPDALRPSDEKLVTLFNELGI